MKIYLDKKMSTDKKYIIKKVEDNHYTIMIERPSFDEMFVLPLSDSDFGFTSRRKNSEMFFAYIGIDNPEIIELFTDDSMKDSLIFKESVYITRRNYFITIATIPFKNFEYDIIFDSENIE